MATEHRVENVSHGHPDDINRLADHLIANRGGSMSKGNARALAQVMAYTCEGNIYGMWGSLHWKHENGQFDSGDVIYHWG